MDEALEHLDRGLKSRDRAVGVRRGARSRRGRGACAPAWFGVRDGRLSEVLQALSTAPAPPAWVYLDVTTLCAWLVVTGRHLGVNRTVLACRVGNAADGRHGCGGLGAPHDAVTRRIAKTRAAPVHRVEGEDWAFTAIPRACLATEVRASGGLPADGFRVPASPDSELRTIASVTSGHCFPDAPIEIAHP